MKHGLVTATLLASFYTWASSPQFSTDRIIVKLREGHALPQHYSIKKYKKLFGQVYVARVKNFKEAESFLKNDKSFHYIERDYYAGKRNLAKTVPNPVLDDKDLDASPFNDPQVSRIWSFKNASSNGVSVSEAYQSRRSAPKEKIIVAVVDTGVDFNHEDLKDVMWTNQNEIPGNNIDDDGNGYVDDIHGINTLVRDANGDATSDMKDAHNHGTHVSGTIGATQNNNTGIAGIASNVEIMGIRTVPNNGDEKDVDVIEAFIYAAKNGAKIINCSFGKDNNEGGNAVSEAIKHIGKEYGTLVIAAAGNDSRNIDQRLSYPASFENNNLLVVASTQSWGGMSFFSNYGLKNVDIAAPGSSIYSTVRNNRYQSMSGTSMAAPTTAGIAAEVLAHFPDLGPVELKNVLMNSVTKVSRFSTKMVAGGRADLKAALNLALDNQ